MSGMSYGLTPSDTSTQKDFTVRANGIDIGRCFLRKMTNGTVQWSWTIYLDRKGRWVGSGIPVAGFSPTLADAYDRLRENFDRMTRAWGGDNSARVNAIRTHSGHHNTSNKLQITEQR